MSAHTKGPWTLVEHSWSRIGIYAGCKGIAALDIYNESTEETEEALNAEMLANARLIAAAPDLLHALHDYMQAIRYAQDQRALMAAIRAADEKANTAIRKAMGDHQ